RPQGRQPCLDVYAARHGLPDGAVPVGRLDADTSGLLIWTDDGDLHQALCRPRSEVWKTYEIVLAGPLDERALPLLREGGVCLDGRPCLPARLTPVGHDGRRWRMFLREGRNRQVRRMFRAVGAEVEALHRTGVGDIELADLPVGEFRELDRDETASLMICAGLRD
ncbi:pseudouridine synthase, partial [bacterium]|nr:pseudouridine synthase [bacterium]